MFCDRRKGTPLSLYLRLHRPYVTHGYLADDAQRLLHPPRAALGEDGLEVAFEEGAGVLEVLFGVGFGGGDALKRFVEDADDPLLFGKRGKANWNGFE